MFGNLKNKLGEVADLKKYTSPQLVNSLGSSRQRSAQHTPGSQTPKQSQHSRQLSTASQESYVSPPNGTKISSVQESSSHSNDGKFVQTSNQMQEQYHDMLKIKEKDWIEKYNKEHYHVMSLQNEVAELQLKQDQLLKELDQEKKSRNTEDDKGDMELKLEHLQDDFDELEGRGTQEVSKVKHLLLNATAEIQSKNELLVKATSSLQEARSELSLLSDQSERIAAFAEERMELETTIAGLKQKLNSTNLKMSQQEKEKCELVKNLEEKITTLTARQQQNGLQENERIQSLIEEREAMENRLEEKRQEVNNIKLSWSEKISQLETQIGNLNEKILEDQLELNTNEELIHNLRLELSKTKEERDNLVKEQKLDFVQKEETINQIKEDLETAKWQFQELEKQKDQELKELRKQLHVKDEHFIQQKSAIKQLEEREAKNTKILTKMTTELTNLKQEYDKLKIENDNLESMNTSLSDSLNGHKTETENLKDELVTLSAKFDIISTEKSKLSDNLDSYVEKVTTLESDLKFSMEENVLYKNNIEQLEAQLIDVRNSHDELMCKIKDSEKYFEEKVLDSDVYKLLQQTVTKLEEELGEKKQIIKMQGQRLSDMKKTIQRELKINPHSTENGESFTNSTSETSLITRARSNEEIIDPVNLSYLRHVLLKFMTSREYEAVQLIKAIGTLLQLTEEEQNLIKETLHYKMSWFGSRPNVGKGQLAKAIPPTQ